ncbi:hypothetical protein EDD92_3407 [Streptomyces sp. TLI_185]|nr:hypothetical protein EDD92_3407 [Streptomyces sp. TLI_185]
MTEYTWPNGVGDPTPEDIRRAWPATKAALPIGTAVTGKVIGRQPFGVFVQIEGVPDGLGLAEIGGTPPGTVPPPLGFVISGSVVDHAERNCQVKLRLDDWGGERAPLPLEPNERLADRVALSGFLRRLRQDYEASGDQWENRTLDSFLKRGWPMPQGGTRTTARSSRLRVTGRSWHGPSAQRGSTSDAVPLACPMRKRPTGNSGESRRTVREPAGQRYARSGRGCVRDLPNWLRGFDSRRPLSVHQGRAGGSSSGPALIVSDEAALAGEARFQARQRASNHRASCADRASESSSPASMTSTTSSVGQCAASCRRVTGR